MSCKVLFVYTKYSIKFYLDPASGFTAPDNNDTYNRSDYLFAVQEQERHNRNRNEFRETKAANYYANHPQMAVNDSILGRRVFFDYTPNTDHEIPQYHDHGEEIIKLQQKQFVPPKRPTPLLPPTPPPGHGYAQIDEDIDDDDDSMNDMDDDEDIDHNINDCGDTDNDNNDDIEPCLQSESPMACGQQLYDALDQFKQQCVPSGNVLDRNKSLKKQHDAILKKKASILSQPDIKVRQNLVKSFSIDIECYVKCVADKCRAIIKDIVKSAKKINSEYLKKVIKILFTTNETILIGVRANKKIGSIHKATKISSMFCYILVYLFVY